MSKNSKQLAKELQSRLSRLAVKGKTLSFRELGVWLVEIDDLYTELYRAAGPVMRLQNFLD
jgi:hypothetical protein